jgi:diacylglycerol kinase family enzyme
MEGVWVIVSMGRYYGGPFTLFPGAEPGNGFMKVLVVSQLNVNTLLRFLPALPFGWHTELEGLHCFQTKKLRVEAVGENSSLPDLELDGELMGSTPVEFTVDPLSLRVAV